MEDYSPCYLHVPHKDWADDPLEKQNYEELEQWSVRLRNYLGGSGGTAPPYHFKKVSYMEFLGYASAVTVGGTTWPNSSSSSPVLYQVDWSANHRVAEDIGTSFTLSGADMIVNDTGMLGWNGYLFFDFYDSTAVNPYGEYWLHLYDTGGHNWLAPQTNRYYLTPLIGRGGTVGIRAPIGGGHYVEEAGSQLQFSIVQTTSFYQQIQLSFCITLIQL